MEKLTLSPDELRDLCQLAGLNVPPPDEDAAAIALGCDDEGEWRAWIQEYPEEGSVPVHRVADLAASSPEQG